MRMRAQVRGLEMRSQLHVFSDSIILASPLAALAGGRDVAAATFTGAAVSASAGNAAAAEARAGSASPPLVGGMAVARVLERVRRRCPISEGLAASEAAASLGYEDLTLSRCGSFFLLADGRRDSIQATPSDRPPPAFKRLAYASLQAFPSGEGRGWGVRCTQSINEAVVVGEMVGRPPTCARACAHAMRPCMCPCMRPRPRPRPYIWPCVDAHAHAHTPCT